MWSFSGQCDFMIFATISHGLVHSYIKIDALVIMTFIVLLIKPSLFVTRLKLRQNNGHPDIITDITSKCSFKKLIPNLFTL